MGHGCNRQYQKTKNPGRSQIWLSRASDLVWVARSLGSVLDMATGSTRSSGNRADVIPNNCGHRAGSQQPPNLTVQPTSARGPLLTHCSVTQASKYAPARRPRRSGIARVTLDLYRLHPKDFLGCLNVKATLYEMYSVSYDIRCTGLKGLLR